MATKEGLVREIPFRYLKEFIDETGVLRRSSSYRSKDDHVRGLVRALGKEECVYLNNAYSNGIDARTSGIEFCEKLRPDEETVRTRFLDQLANKVDPDREAVFCEFPLGRNRSDVNRFNGSSYTYELKSPRDSFKRLPEQLDSYTEVFEFIYIVLPQDMAPPEDLPENIGLITYSYPDYHFDIESDAEQVKNQNPEFQLKQLWLDELADFADKSVPSDCSTDEKKETLIDEVLEEYSPNEINNRFKTYIKERYAQDGPKQGIPVS